MPPPVEVVASLRWQLLTDALDTRARWTAHCARMILRDRQGQAAGPQPRVPPTPGRDGTETAAVGPAFILS